MKNKIKIDIVSDVVCPWCIIGYKRLEKAIKELGIQDQLEVEWQPFELNPHMPKEGQDITEHITEKYGSSIEQFEATQQRMTEIAAELDFKFDYFKDMRIVNTFEAHVLLDYAKKFNKQTDLKLRLMTAYFSERQDVSNHDVLKQALIDVGLNAEEGMALLENDEARYQVKTEEAFWQNAGVKSVPTVVFDRKSAVTGAQPVDVFKDVLSEMLEKVE